MKVKNYALLGLFLLTTILTTYAQCNSIDAGDDRTIVCGDSISLLGQPKWSDGLDSTTSYFRSVFFTDSITGYTVGDNGIIHKTINGGLSWVSQNSGVTNNLQSVVFTNATTGYAVGENGIILKTINAGANWTTQTSGSASTLYSVYFTDSNTGIAVGTNGIILKTVNAGVSWSIRKSNLTTNLISVHFPTINVGYASTEGKIIKTTDGGETWTTIQNGAGNIYIKIFFTNAGTGYVTLRDANGANTILKTVDGGINWKALNVGSSYAISSLFFTDPKTGYAGSVGRIFKTNDGGITWESQSVNLLNVEDIHFPTFKTGYAVGSGTAVKNTLKYKVPDLISWLPASGLNSSTIINPTVSPTTSTTYTLTTKSGTCILTDSVRITVTPLKVDAGSNQKIICGGSVQLNGVSTNYSGKLNYAWLPKKGLSDPASANPVVTVQQTTTYTLTVTTPNGCIATDTITILVNPLLANAGTDKTIICGGSVKLPAVISNYTGSGTLTYSWLPAIGLDSYTIPDPVSDAIKETNYNVTVTTPDGCKATDTITVFVTPLKADAGSDKTLICGGGAQLDKVTSNYTGSGKLTYSWVPAGGINNPTSANPFVMITQSQTYKVTVSTPNGCSAVDSVMISVKPLLVDAGIDKLHFCGDSVKLDDVRSNYTGTASLSYSWLPVIQLSNSTISNPVSTAGAITYTVTITTENGCKSSDSVKVLLKKIKPIEICMVCVDSTGKNKIIWNHPLSKIINMVFIYKEKTPSNFEKIAEVAYPKGEFIDSASLPATKSDKYKIAVLDSCGLESSQSIVHKTMFLSVKKGAGTSWSLSWEAYEGFSVSSYYIYRGRDKSNLQLYGVVSGSTLFTDVNPLTGIIYYQVEALSPNACGGVNGNSVRSNTATGSAVGIEELSTELNFSLYPNPATTAFSVDMGGLTNGKFTINIYNSMGQVMKSVSLQQNQQQIDVSDLNDGFYLVELKSASGRSVQKLVIEE